jgi:aspartyl-tRNA(Asn)/glutamyl-tRNA(Gln) amidotransferase subunit A
MLGEPPCSRRPPPLVRCADKELRAFPKGGRFAAAARLSLKPRDCPPGVFLALPEEMPAGIPLAVKDLFDTAGLVTTYGSPLFAEHVPSRTASAVATLEAAGYAVVGKTNLHEFAYGTTSENPHFGVVPNPAAPGRVAGGSSGGSAAALVLGAAELALGTDSGGSIRIPAACCGVVGFKPTYGLVSLEGCFPLAPSFDHAGPMARDVRTCEAALGALAAAFETRTLESLEEIDVAVAWLDEADPLVRSRVGEAAALFPRGRRVALPPPEGIGRLFMHEVAGIHRELYSESSDLYSEDLRIKIERCLEVTDVDAERAAQRRKEYVETIEGALDGIDLVVTPTLPCVAPPIGAGGTGDLDVREAMISRTFPFNVLGWPALALPCGAAEDGLPASVQLAGRPGTDALVLAAGRLLESALAG